MLERLLLRLRVSLDAQGKSGPGRRADTDVQRPRLPDAAPRGRQPIARLPDQRVTLNMRLRAALAVSAAQRIGDLHVLVHY